MTDWTLKVEVWGQDLRSPPAYGICDFSTDLDLIVTINGETDPTVGCLNLYSLTSGSHLLRCAAGEFSDSVSLVTNQNQNLTSCILVWKRKRLEDCVIELRKISTVDHSIVCSDEIACPEFVTIDFAVSRDSLQVFGCISDAYRKKLKDTPNSANITDINSANITEQMLIGNLSHLTFDLLGENVSRCVTDSQVFTYSGTDYSQEYGPISLLGSGAMYTILCCCDYLASPSNIYYVFRAYGRRRVTKDKHSVSPTLVGKFSFPHLRLVNYKLGNTSI